VSTSPAGDGQGRAPSQFDETVSASGNQRFLEPRDVVLSKMVRRAQRPFVALLPVGITRARIDHQLRVGAHRVARGADDGFVGFASTLPKVPSPILNARNPRRRIPRNRRRGARAPP
jgi:hypothetical protein